MVKTKSYNDAVVRGEWTFSTNAIEKLFPEMYNVGILDYIMFRNFKHDERVELNDPRTYYKVVLKAVTKKDRPDEFTMDVGEKITEMKLQYKALDFAKSLRENVEKEVNGLIEAIENSKCPAFCDLETLKQNQKDFRFSVTGNVSYANLTIPLEPLNDYQLSIRSHVEKICEAMERRLLWRRDMKNNDCAGRAIDVIVESFRTELLERIESSFSDLSRIKIFGNDSDPKGIAIRKISRRNPEDENDPKVAETRLMSKLFNYWVSINKRVKRLAVKIIKNSMNLSVSGKFIHKIDRKRKQYESEGIRYKALQDILVNQYGVNNKV